MLIKIMREMLSLRNKPSRRRKCSAATANFMFRAISKADGKVKVNISLIDIVKRVKTLETSLDQGKKKFTLAQDKEIIDKVI